MAQVLFPNVIATIIRKIHLFLSDALLIPVRKLLPSVTCSTNAKDNVINIGRKRNLAACIAANIEVCIPASTCILAKFYDQNSIFS